MPLSGQGGGAWYGTVDEVSRVMSRPHTFPRVCRDTVAESAVGTPISATKPIDMFSAQVADGTDGDSYSTDPTSVCVKVKCERLIESPLTFDESRSVTAIVGFDVNVQTSEWLSFTAQLTSVSVRAKMPSDTPSVEKVPVVPTRPPCGQGTDPPIGTETAEMLRAPRLVPDSIRDGGVPRETPSKVESAEVIDWSCWVVKSLPGCVVESLPHAATNTTAAIAEPIFHMLEVMAPVVEGK